MGRIRAIAGAYLLTFGVIAGLAVAIGGGPSASASGSPLHGPLAVSGTKIVDVGNGNLPVELHGVGVTAEFPGPYPGGIIDAKGLQTLQAWGANFVRLAISSDEIVQNCSGESYDPTFRSELASTIANLSASGIYTVIDISSTDPNCIWNAPQSSDVAPLAGEDAVPALQYLAATYGSNPLVGFEPFNEPQACAEAASGPAATVYVPAYAEPNDACANETLSSLAWSNPGTAEAVGTSLFGLNITTNTYQTPGMDALYSAVMNNLPAGARPLMFMDANYWASDPATFDNLGTLQSASNIVEVYHPYDCQDTSSSSDAHQNGLCHETTPETCETTAKLVHRDITDSVNGLPQNRPVVFDEFNFPAQENVYQGPSSILAGTLVPLNLYQNGLWVNNMITAMRAQGAAGWAVYTFQNADVDNVVTPYSMVQPGVSTSTPAPWAVNANDAPAVAAMQGQTLGCQEPPLGFDVAM